VRPFNLQHDNSFSAAVYKVAARFTTRNVGQNKIQEHRIWT